MRLYPECGPCMMQRALMFCRDENDEIKREVVRGVSKLFAEKFIRDYSTTKLAYERNIIVESITGNKDPMKDIKEESFKAALKLYPKLKEYVTEIRDDKERFRTALKIALAGNTLEFGARDHKPDLYRLENEVFSVVNEKPYIDDTDRIYEEVRKAKRVLYVTDNAAEVVMDKVFIEELSEYLDVEIAPLSRPVQDDASLEEIKKAGLYNNYRITPRGDSIGIWFEKATPGFLESYRKADFVVAKGMGCYESLMDYPERMDGRIGLLMKVKCMPVSRDVKAPLGSTVVAVM